MANRALLYRNGMFCYEIQACDFSRSIMDGSVELFCPGTIPGTNEKCNAPMFPRIIPAQNDGQIKYCFVSNDHRPGCNLAKKANVVAVRKYTLDKIDLDSFVVEETPASKTPMPGKGTVHAPGQEIENEYQTLPAIKEHLSSPTNAEDLFFALSERDLDEEIGKKPHKVREVLVNDITIGELRESTEPGIKCLLARPCANYKSSIDRPWNHLVFQDVYTNDNRAQVKSPLADANKNMPIMFIVGFPNNDDLFMEIYQEITNASKVRNDFQDNSITIGYAICSNWTRYPTKDGRIAFVCTVRGKKQIKKVSQARLA